MRFFAVIIVIVIAISAAEGSVFKAAEYTKFFQGFVTRFKRGYTAGASFASRFNIFKANLDKITLANAKQNAGWKVNDFADLSHAEFKAMLGLKPTQNALAAVRTGGRGANLALVEEEVDIDAFLLEIDAPNNNDPPKKLSRKERQAAEKAAKEKAAREAAEKKRNQPIDPNIPDSQLTPAQRLQKQLEATQRLIKEREDKVKAEEAERQRRRDIVAEWEKKPFDWRDKKVLSSVKHQRTCGSCWAFSVLGALEAGIAIKYNIPPPNLSEQHLVDCDTTNNACKGGWFSNAYNYLIKNGARETSVYGAYTASQRTCIEESKAKYQYQPTGFKNVAGVIKPVRTDYDVDLMHGLMSQPLAIALKADPSLQFWGAKTLYPENCTDQKPIIENNREVNPNDKIIVDHAVVLVGHGKDKDGVPVYIIRNSWGETWGNGDGHFYMARSPGTNNCGVHIAGYYPTFD